MNVVPLGEPTGLQVSPPSVVSSTEYPVIGVPPFDDGAAVRLDGDVVEELDALLGELA